MTSIGKFHVQIIRAKLKATCDVTRRLEVAGYVLAILLRTAGIFRRSARSL